MKKLINDPGDVVADALRGVEAARHLVARRVRARAQADVVLVVLVHLVRVLCAVAGESSWCVS